MLTRTGRGRLHPLVRAVPIALSGALLLAACRGESGDAVAGAQDGAVDGAPAPEPAAGADAPLAARRAAPEPGAPAQAATGAARQGPTASGSSALPAPKVHDPAASAPASDPASTSRRAGMPATGRASGTEESGGKTSKDARAGRARSAPRGGATDVGVTRTSIRLGTVNMHGMALGNILITPQVAGMRATLAAINDRGGILGRRLELVDCDDGPGEVSRAKSCIKKLVDQDKIFAMLTSVTWSSASLHDDLRQNRLPLIGAWAYSQTEWQNPYMFPTHMSMLHEALANANWVRDVIKPKTYGLLCLTSPEMQLACTNVSKVLDAAGVKLAKKVDVSISETSMAGPILSMRAAAPDHIVHYVINAATVAKFMVEAAQQNYYPPRGVSGNHLAAEVLGGLLGRHPVNRYWINTTYKLWGSEYMAVMNKYARGNKGKNHHILQAGYTGANFFAAAAKEVGPDLTRKQLMAVLASDRIWSSDVSLDQRFSWRRAERGEGFDGELANGREFMYQYTDANTVANPNGSPSGFRPAENFVIHARD